MSPSVIPFSPTFTQSGPVGFDPNTTTPASTPSGTNQAPQLPFTLTATQSGPVRNNFFGPTPLSGLTGVAAQMGGARGARSWGGRGITGEAAQSFLEGLRYGPNSDAIYTGSGGPIRQ